MAQNDLVIASRQSDNHMVNRAEPLGSNTTELTLSITFMHAVYCLDITYEEQHTLHKHVNTNS